MIQQYEKAYILDPVTGELCEGFYITRDQDAVKVINGRAYVNGIEKTIRSGMSGIRVDEQKYNRTISRRLAGSEFSDPMTAQPPRF